MFCDVTICWNSTHDMLNFVLDYHVAYDEITGEWNMKLRQYTDSAQICDPFPQ